jgi:hypothetical protein
MTDDLIHRALVERAKSLARTGIALTVISPLPPLLAPDHDRRWPIAVGLLVAGGICMGVSHWVLGRLR